MELQLWNRNISNRATATSVTPSSFVQQGTVDWPSLAKASVTASVSVLTRFSGAGVEAWTAMFAQVVLGTFQLSTKGEARLNEALGKLTSFGSAGDLMYFGFGVKHIVRTLAESREGMVTVALCASLSEAHSLEMSTSIIKEYAKLYGAGATGNLVPSYRQWEALVRTCSGVLAQSPFGVVVEFFWRLNPHSGERQRFCGNIKDVAHAMEGLAKISSGLMKSMVLKGDSSLAFLAAIAQWLLDLRVVVQDASGHIVYPSVEPDVNDYQLMIIYVDDRVTSESVARVGGAYYIGSLEDVITNKIENVCLNGRVEWANALGHTFGSSATKLLQVPTLLGALFGGAAKLYSLGSDEAPTPETPRLFLNTRPGASARAFIDLACRTLPELADSRNAMENTLEQPDDEAYLHFEKASSLLREVCGCREFCSQNGPANKPRPACLLLLAHTAIQLIRQVFTIASIPADIRPRRRGLEHLYDLLRTKDTSTNLYPLHALDYIGLLDLAATLFGFGHEFIEDREGSTSRISVFSSGGVCFVLDGVLELSVKKEQALRVHIIPGQIEWDSKLYEKAYDGRPGGSWNVIPQMVLPVSKALFEAQMQLIASMTTRAVVSESFGELGLSYEIISTSGNSFLGPRHLGDHIARASSNVSCFGQSCRPYNRLQEDFRFMLSLPPPPGSTTSQTVSGLDLPEKPVIMLFGENKVARCVPLVLYYYRIILQDTECIACCARRAMKTDKPHEVIIISHLTVEDIERVMQIPNTLVNDA
ncbi:MAG: hypothetical protein HETSPECPRED_002559 [Heterodermia speciosa]|uniref:Uncharacterized protein n=1 Tax=Heterodermia speciosa TaxID=116794 RepID=A0A8H3F462_9LECA|nr:MAG: hypothetical protein HETSPECPRED_002559 [Heterodermia speciosa]